MFDHTTCKLLQSEGCSFVEGSKQDQKELGVGKWEERVGGDPKDEKMSYSKAHLFSGGAVCWLGLSAGKS